MEDFQTVFVAGLLLFFYSVHYRSMFVSILHFQPAVLYMYKKSRALKTILKPTRNMVFHQADFQTVHVQPLFFFTSKTQ